MAIVAQGATLEIGTGSGSAKNITAISLGAITEITSAAHGLSEGDVVAFAAIGGTTELNGQTAMIIGAETDTFFVDIDSSAYSAYTSGGTATPVAWTEVGEVTDWDGPGGTAAVIDITHLQSAFKEKLAGLPDEGQLSLSINFDADDTGQQACQTARANSTEKDFRLTYSDATVQTFSGFVLGFASSGGVDAKVAGSITIEITGQVVTT